MFPDEFSTEGRDVVIPPAPDGPLCLVSSVLPRWDVLHLEVTSIYHRFELDAFLVVEADVCRGWFIPHVEVETVLESFS